MRYCGGMENIDKVEMLGTNTATGTGLTTIRSCHVADDLGFTDPELSHATVVCQAVFVGRNEANGDAVSVKKHATFRLVDTTLTRVGIATTAEVQADTDLLGVTTDLSVDGMSVRARASGATDVTLNWAVWLTFWVYEPYP